MRIAVVGLGYVGLPLAVEFGKKFPTVGIDLSSEKVAAYRNFVDPTGEVSSEDLRAATLLSCHTDASVLSDADFIVVQIRDGDTLRATLNGTGVQASIIDDKGTVIAGPSADAQAADLPAGDFIVKIEPTGDPAFYDADFSCKPTLPLNIQSPGCGCSSDGSSSAGLGVALLALLSLRRRRRRRG